MISDQNPSEKPQLPPQNQPLPSPQELVPLNQEDHKAAQNLNIESSQSPKLNLRPKRSTQGKRMTALTEDQKKADEEF